MTHSTYPFTSSPSPVPPIACPTEELIVQPYSQGLKTNSERTTVLPKYFNTRWEDRGLPEPPHFLVDRLLPLGALCIIYGPSGIGKTKVLLQMSHAITNGLDFQGRPTCATKVIHFDYEMGEAGLLRYGAELGLRGNIVPMHNIPLEDIPRVIREAAEEGGRLFVIDSYASIANSLGIENAVNSNGVAERILKPLADLAHELGVTIVLLHHTNKLGHMYDGSQRIKGLADVMLKLRIDSERLGLELQVDKSRYELEGLQWEAPGHPLLKRRGNGSEEPDTQEQYGMWALQALQEKPATLSDLAPGFKEAFDKTPKTLERALTELYQQGRIKRERVKSGFRYEVVDGLAVNTDPEGTVT